MKIQEEGLFRFLMYRTEGSHLIIIKLPGFAFLYFLMILWLKVVPSFKAIVTR